MKPLIITPQIKEIQNVFKKYYTNGDISNYSNSEEWNEAVDTFLKDVEKIFRNFGDKRRIFSTNEKTINAAIDLLERLK